MAVSHDPVSVLLRHRFHSPQHTENNRPARIVSSSVTSNLGFWYHGGITMKPEAALLDASGIWIRCSQYTKQNSTTISIAVVKYNPTTSPWRNTPSSRTFQALLMGTPVHAGPRD